MDDNDLWGGGCDNTFLTTIFLYYALANVFEETKDLKKYKSKNLYITPISDSESVPPALSANESDNRRTGGAKKMYGFVGSGYRQLLSSYPS